MKDFLIVEIGSKTIELRDSQDILDDILKKMNQEKFTHKLDNSNLENEVQEQTKEVEKLKKMLADTNKRVATTINETKNKPAPTLINDDKSKEDWIFEERQKFTPANNITNMENTMINDDSSHAVTHGIFGRSSKQDTVDRNWKPMVDTVNKEAKRIQIDQIFDLKFGKNVTQEHGQRTFEQPIRGGT